MPVIDKHVSPECGGLCLKLVRMFGQASIQKLDREKAEQVKSTITWNSSREEALAPLAAFQKQLAAEGFSEMEIGTLCDGMMYHRRVSHASVTR